MTSVVDSVLVIAHWVTTGQDFRKMSSQILLPSENLLNIIIAPVRKYGYSRLLILVNDGKYVRPRYKVRNKIRAAKTKLT